ncbi:MAG: GerMN domain-containing protein [Firmicutes bacterium]|nr:GerMN domain-containing protein [Bacillota bacterium]
MRKVYTIFLVLLLLLNTGCSLPWPERENLMPPSNQEEDRPQAPEGANFRETLLFLPDESWQFLLPVRVYIPWEEGIAKATLRYCTEGHLPGALLGQGMAPLLPAGTKILGLALRDGRARVDFSEEFLSFPPEREKLLIAGITYTLTEFPTIDEVEILVGGAEPQFPAGTRAEPFSRALGLNLEIAEAVTDFAETDRVTLYFLYAAGENVYYLPVTRVVPKTDDLVHKTVEELLSGPAPGKKLFTAVPDGLTLQSIQQEGAKVILHLTGDFFPAGGQLAADRFWQQVALTLTEIAGIEEVSLLINGQVPAFGPEIHFPESFARPQKWNLVAAAG